MSNPRVVDKSIVKQFQVGIFTSLTIFFLIASITTSAIAFLYPLEIELRESSVWLHVLALKQGINIYDHSQVAFVNMNHGPFDSLFKLLISSLLPFLESWQVVRFSVFLLPYLFLFISWKVLEKSPNKSWWDVLYLGSLGYIFIMSLPNSNFLLVGRSDATAILFFLLFVYFSLSFLPKKNYLHGLICGVLGIIVILTNWRFSPVVLSVLCFTVWHYKYIYKYTYKSMLIYIASYLIGSITIWLCIFSYFFHLNWDLYYRHFFGFFAPVSGVGVQLVPSVGLFIKGLSVPVILGLILYLVIPRKKQIINIAWGVFIGCVFLFCAISYYLNAGGGGIYYFAPFIVVIYFFYSLNYLEISKKKITFSGIILLIIYLLLSMEGSAGFPKDLVLTMSKAGDFMTQVRTLEKTNTILSEDTFLFRKSYKGETIDAGDTVSAVSKTHFYGEDFDNTAKRHFTNLITHPPDYITSGFIVSPELAKLLKEQKYVIVAQGPNNLIANVYESSYLFRRNSK